MFEKLAKIIDFNGAFSGALIAFCVERGTGGNKWLAGSALIFTYLTVKGMDGIARRVGK
jgi:hypothetical protein